MNRNRDACNLSFKLSDLPGPFKPLSLQVRLMRMKQHADFFKKGLPEGSKVRITLVDNDIQVLVHCPKERPPELESMDVKEWL